MRQAVPLFSKSTVRRFSGSLGRVMMMWSTRDLSSRVHGSVGAAWVVVEPVSRYAYQVAPIRATSTAPAMGRALDFMVNLCEWREGGQTLSSRRDFARRLLSKRPARPTRSGRPRMLPHWKRRFLLSLTSPSSGSDTSLARTARRS